MELILSKVLEAEPVRVYRVGKETLSLVVGKHLKIETSPQGQEILDAVVPSGKVWRAFIQITIEETNV